MRKATKLYFLILAFAALLAGVAAGTALMFAAFDHNPQGEFWDPQTGEIVYGPTLLVFFAWFVVAFTYVFAAGSAVYVVFRLGHGAVRRLKSFGTSSKARWPS